MSTPPDDLSPVLLEATAGNESALRQLDESVYAELYRLAQWTMAAERPDHTLQPTGLVHEAYLRLIQQRNLPVDHRSKSLATAAAVMRRVLVDYARARNANKRGGQQERRHLELELIGLDAENQIDILAIHEALGRLTQEHERAARVVEMRFFSGMNNLEIAQELSVSTKTVQNDWVFSKAWLYREMSSGENHDSCS